MAKRKDWSSITAQYLQRTCTLDEFCKQHEIKPATLQYHLKQHRSGAASERFLPVGIHGEPKEEVTLEFTSGLRLTIRG